MLPVHDRSQAGIAAGASCCKRAQNQSQGELGHQPTHVLGHGNSTVHMTGPQSPAQKCTPPSAPGTLKLTEIGCKLLETTSVIM